MLPRIVQLIKALQTQIVGEPEVSVSLPDEGYIRFRIAWVEERWRLDYYIDLDSIDDFMTDEGELELIQFAVSGSSQFRDPKKKERRS